MSAKGSSTNQQWGTAPVPGSPANIIIAFTNSPKGTNLVLGVGDNNALVVTSLLKPTPPLSQQWQRGDHYLTSQLSNGLVADYSGTGSQVTLATKINGKPKRQQFDFLVRLICWERRRGHRVSEVLYTVCIGIKMFNMSF